MSKAEVFCDCQVIHTDIVEKAQKNIPDNATVDSLSAFFKLISDNTRIKILFALCESEMCVCDIAALIGMTKSATSHQLKLLKKNNIIQTRRQGKVVFCYLCDNHVREILKKTERYLYE